MLSSLLFQALDWLKAAINECERRLANSEGDQQGIAQEISAGQARLKELNADIARLERQKADLVQKRKSAARELEARKQEQLASIESKKSLLQKKKQSLEDSRENLANARQAAKPFLAEIGSLRAEVETLEQDITVKTQQLEECGGGVRKRIEELQKRKEFALSLMAGYAQKMEFTKELLVENPALATKEIDNKVSRYGQLNQHLQKCFLEDGEKKIYG